jgi:hypothetical protein
MNTEMQETPELLPPPVVEAPVAPRPKFPKMSKGAWAGLIVVVLVLMGMIGNAFDKNDDTDTGLVNDVDIETTALDMTWEGPKGREAVCPPLRELVANGIDRETAVGFAIEGIMSEMTNLSAAGKAHLSYLLAECF